MLEKGDGFWVKIEGNTMIRKEDIEIVYPKIKNLLT